MGLFGKLKNILFEDDDEIEEMPVYTKEEVEEVKDEVPVEPVKQIVQEDLEVQQPIRFRNVKRDIDMTFEEEDVLGEIPGAFDNVIPQVKEEAKPQVEVKPIKEEKSIFPSFDETEFERANQRVNHEAKEIVRKVDVPVIDNSSVNVRQANNNFSSTDVSEEQRDPDRYKINTGTIVNGKKPFTPSPVISPVYGILDKNYTKDEIIDRKGGLKRERTNRPLKKERTIEDAENSMYEEEEISVDSIRKKAYGDEIELPKEHKKVKEEEISEEKIEIPKINAEKGSKPSEEVYREVEDIPEVVQDVVPEVEEVVEVPSIEDQIEDENYDVSEEVDQVIEEVVPEEKKEQIEKKKMRVMDDLEKTSTLKILDDIEKELNSIKPISKEAEEEENKEIKEHEKTLDDTLENDLFNLIDSMYEEGDEEDD